MNHTDSHEKTILIKEGKYITDRTSISVAEWDEEMHVENGDRIVRYINGSVKVTTIIVPEEKMMEIIDGITKSEDPGRIVIDTGNVKTRLYDEQMSTNRNTEISTANYESFKQLRDEVMQSIHQHDRFDISDVPSFNNTDTSGKGLK